MSKKELDSRFGKRNKMVTARITEADAEILKKNNISVSLAIEEYIDNNLNVYARMQYILKQKEKKLAELEKAYEEKPNLLKEIEKLRKEIGYTLIDGLEVSPQAKASAESFANEFIDKSIQYKDLDAYIKDNKDIIAEKSLKLNLTLNAFSKLIYKEYETLFAEKQAVENEKETEKYKIYESLSEDLSADDLKQLHYAVERANKFINGNAKPSFENINAYIKANDRFIDNYVSNCNLTKERFIKLMKEAFSLRFTN